MIDYDDYVKQYDEYNNRDFYIPHSKAEPPTLREWVLCGILLALGLGLSFFDILPIL